MNDISHLIDQVQDASINEAKKVVDLTNVIMENDKREHTMDLMDLALDQNRSGQSKKELDDVENELIKANDKLTNIERELIGIGQGLGAWSNEWMRLFGQLKQSTDEQLLIQQEQLLLEDQSRIADEEARRESQRAKDAGGFGGPPSGGDGSDRAGALKPNGESESTGGLFKIFSSIAAIGALAKLFDVDEFMRIPATLALMFKKIDAISKPIMGVIAAAGEVSATLGKVLGSVGSFLKPLGSLLGKFALPITVIMGVLDGIEGFLKGYADTGSILTGIREAFVGILDGLVGTLVRFAGDVIAFIPDIIGLDAVAETIKDLFDGVVDGFVNMFRGVLDTVMGILTLDFDRLTNGLGTLLFGFADTIQELMFAPFNLAINFFRDVFGFSEEDAPPFRIQDVILDTINSIADWFTNLFDFEFPDFSLSSLLPSWLGGEEESNKRGMEIPSETDGAQLSERGQAAVDDLKGSGVPEVDPETGKRGMVIPPSPIIGSMSDGVGDLLSRGQSIFTAAASGAMDFGGQALDTAGEFGGQAVDAAGDAFDTVSETVGGAAADAVSAVKDKASQLFDPIKNAFNSMIDTVKGIFDFGKIGDMLTNMFAEIGIPRVEFDVPFIGPVGFGPFYPFRPGEGEYRDNTSKSHSTESSGSNFKSTSTDNSSGMTNDSIFSYATESVDEQSKNELGQIENISTQTGVTASFDDMTGKGRVSFETTKTIDNLATDEFKELEDTVKEFEVGPIVMGKVRRMIDAGATPTQVKEFLEENEKTIADKISEFLSPVTNKAKDLVGQATEAATDLAYDAEDVVTGAGSAVGDVASDAGYGVMDQVDKVSGFIGGLFDQARAAMTENPFESLDEDTKDEIDAIRASLFSLRGGQDSLGNTDNAQLEGTNEQSEQLQQTIDKYVKDAADLAGMTPEQFLAAEKILDASGQSAGRALSYSDVEDFDFDTVEPLPSKSLSAPVGQASQEVAANQGTQNNIAVTPVNNVSTNSNVNNNYNTTNIGGNTPSRSTDPTFQRMQNANFGGL